MASSRSASRFSSSSPATCDHRLAAKPRRNRTSVWSGWSGANGRRISKASGKRLRATKIRAVLTRGSEDKCDCPGDAGAPDNPPPWLFSVIPDIGDRESSVFAFSLFFAGRKYCTPPQSRHASGGVSGVKAEDVFGCAPDAEAEAVPSAAKAGRTESRSTWRSGNRIATIIWHDKKEGQPGWLPFYLSKGGGLSPRPSGSGRRHPGCYGRCAPNAPMKASSPGVLCLTT